MPRVAQICSQLRGHGRRLTPQRQAIIRALSQECQHPTADEIFRVVRERMPDISAATVYNTLNELSEMELLAEIPSVRGEHRYDANLDPHDHVVCVVCGCIEDVVSNGISSRLTPADACGFEIIGHRLVFLGYCPACKRDTHITLEGKEN